MWYGMEDPFNNNDGAYWTGVEEPEYGYNGRSIEPSNVAKSLLVDLSGFTSAASLKAYGLNIRAVINPKEAGIEDVVDYSNNTTIRYRDGKLYITDNNVEGEIMLYDLSGRMVFSGSVSNGVSSLPSLSNGIYLVSYSFNGNVVTTQKIMIV